MIVTIHREVPLVYGGWMVREVVLRVMLLWFLSLWEHCSTAYAPHEQESNGCHGGLLEQARAR